jgi:DNA-3-methyladenine glycosylase II
MTATETAMVDEQKRSAQNSGPRPRKRAPLADRTAREVLRRADPVLAHLIDARPDFRPRAWMDELPPLDAFGTLIFQVAGQQQRFVDGRLSDDALARMTDAEVEAALTEVPGIGPWTARGFLLVGLDRPDVFLSGDLALRRAVGRVYGFDHPPTDEEMTELSDRWRPYRSLAVSYLFASEYDV